MRADDRAWLQLKLDALAKTGGDDAFDMPFPPDGEKQRMPVAWSRPSRRSCAGAASSCGALRGDSRSASRPSPVLDAMFALKEPQDRHRRHAVLDGRRRSTRDRRRLRAGPEGDQLPDGSDAAVFGLAVGRLSARARRPVQDPVARHARARPGVDRHEAAQAARLTRAARRLHGVRARASSKQQTCPSTIAYLARLIIHRYAMLGVLDEDGYPRSEMGILEPARRARSARRVMAGAAAPSAATRR